MPNSQRILSPVQILKCRIPDFFPSPVLSWLTPPFSQVTPPCPALSSFLFSSFLCGRPEGHVHKFIVAENKITLHACFFPKLGPIFNGEQRAVW